MSLSINRMFRTYTTFHWSELGQYNQFVGLNRLQLTNLSFSEPPKDLKKLKWTLLMSKGAMSFEEFRVAALHLEPLDSSIRKLIDMELPTENYMTLSQLKFAKDTKPCETFRRIMSLYNTFLAEGHAHVMHPANRSELIQKYKITLRDAGRLITFRCQGMRGAELQEMEFERVDRSSPFKRRELFPHLTTQELENLQSALVCDYERLKKTLGKSPTDYPYGNLMFLPYEYSINASFVGKRCEVVGWNQFVQENLTQNSKELGILDHLASHY